MNDNNDKELLRYLITQNKTYKEYIFRLYKIYDLCNRYTMGDIEKNKYKLDFAEDKIYMVNGKGMTSQERIYHEIKKIYNAILAQEDNQEKLDNSNELIDIINKYRDSLKEDDSTRKKVELETKEKISLLQAKYDLPISFLYAASKKFKEIYDAQIINKFGSFETIRKNIYDYNKENKFQGDSYSKFYNDNIDEYKKYLDVINNRVKKKDGGNL